MVTGAEVHYDTVPAVFKEEPGDTGQDEGRCVPQQGETGQYQGGGTTQECTCSQTK